MKAVLVLKKETENSTTGVKTGFRYVCHILEQLKDRSQTRNNPNRCLADSHWFDKG